MKRILILSICVAMMSSCGKKEDTKQSEATESMIDSTVIGKDTSPVDTRKDLPMSDEKKKSIPGQATKPTTSDENN
ncbi:hypothetical protein L0657_22370 [Dyadobacter sp. CY345]|uniref:hypothetical protein n=1 Tax=Dyadobacter sp. CY345 TaxID=2909335 RepID=UPI001F1826FF|nr:hypothetical protein [Dyadobacter sp. CY345]MCF2446719.1 hypothetical protein [Dyadobacter sp. CY345]